MTTEALLQSLKQSILSQASVKAISAKGYFRGRYGYQRSADPFCRNYRRKRLAGVVLAGIGLGMFVRYEDVAEPAWF